MVDDNSDWDIVLDGSESHCYRPDSRDDDDNTSLPGAMNDQKNGSGGTEEEVDFESLPDLCFQTGGLDEETETAPEMALLRERCPRNDRDLVNLNVIDDDETWVDAGGFTSSSSSLDTCQRLAGPPQPFTSDDITESQPQTTPTQPPQLLDTVIHHMSSIIATLLRALDSPEGATLKKSHIPILSCQLRDLQCLAKHPEATPQVIFALTNLASAIQNSLKTLPSVEESFRFPAEKEDVPAWARTIGSENFAAAPYSRSRSFVFHEEDTAAPLWRTPHRRGAISLESPLPEFQMSLCSPEMEHSILEPKAWRDLHSVTKAVSPSVRGVPG